MTAAVKLLSLIRCFVGCCLDFLDGAKEARPPETANLKQAKNKQTAMKQKKKKKKTNLPLQAREPYGRRFSGYFNPRPQKTPYGRGARPQGPTRMAANPNKLRPRGKIFGFFPFLLLLLLLLFFHFCHFSIKPLFFFSFSLFPPPFYCCWLCAAAVSSLSRPPAGSVLVCLAAQLVYLADQPSRCGKGNRRLAAVLETEDKKEN